MSTINHADLLTPAELAERLKVPKSWVYEKTRGRSRDPLPVMRIGKYMRFHWPEIVTWLQAHAERSLT
jgi:excisionase family DNA binding protein